MSDVAIWITCRNYEHYLPEVLNSVYAQTIPCHVYVSHDDCGGDHPVGLSANRNRFLRSGVAQMAKYVIFLDADDILLRNYAEDLLCLADGADAVVTCKAQMFGDSNADILPQMPVTLESIMASNSIHCAALIPVKHLVASGGYDETLPAWEDWDLWIRLCKMGVEFRYAAGTQLMYRRHAGSMNHVYGPSHDDYRNKFRVKYGGQA